MALNGIRLIIFTEDSIEELKKRINEKWNLLKILKKL
jgi:hypothetical protein